MYRTLGIRVDGRSTKAPQDGAVGSPGVARRFLCMALAFFAGADYHGVCAV
jgi:hypothetical protein